MYPWSPRLARSQCSNAPQNSCIMLNGFASPPLFSLDQRTLLKSTMHTHGFIDQLWRYLNRAHVSFFRWSSGWPYTPVSRHCSYIGAKMYTSMWLREKVYESTVIESFHNKAMPPLLRILGIASMELKPISFFIGSISCMTVSFPWETRLWILLIVF